MSAIHTFFLAMVCFPQVQKKAQAEIDRVVIGRLPDFGDMDELPYLSAIVKEVLRFVFLTFFIYERCPQLFYFYFILAPFNSDGNQSHQMVRFITYPTPYIYSKVLIILFFAGVPHCPIKDDVYEGYHIPKGSIVIFNTW